MAASINANGWRTGSDERDNFYDGSGKCKLKGRLYTPGSIHRNFPMSLKDWTGRDPEDEHVSLIYASKDWTPQKVGSIIRSELPVKGSLVFRGLDITCAKDLNKFAEALGYESMPYVGGTSIRNPIDGIKSVQTASNEPPEMTIEPHNEMAYSTIFPGVLIFHCFEQGRLGGETPLHDSRKIASSLDSRIREKLERYGITYYVTRNSLRTAGIDSAWEGKFAETKEETEAILRKYNLNFRWQGQHGDQLVTWITVPAFRRHPITGEVLWFGQPHSMHRTYIEAQPYYCPGQGEVFHTRYGNGEEFTEEELAHIRQVTWRNSVAFRLQPGDFLVMDNLRVGHGRMSFSGTRRIGVVLLDPQYGNTMPGICNRL